jgi:predicted aconitase with swiveling domain
MVGSQVGQGVPYFFMPSNSVLLSREEMREGHKALAAAMAATGAVALFHIDGVTPEADRAGGNLGGLPEMEVNSLAEGYRLVSGACGRLDVIVLGCPHAACDEIERAAALVKGKQVKTRLWICTSRYVFRKAAESGLRDEIERCGARLLADMCLVVAPLAELGIKSVATNSAKTAYYLRSREGVSVSYGSLQECIDAALSGEWKGAARTAETRLSGAPVSVPFRKPMHGALHGVAVVEGHARGEALCCREPIGFFGHVNPQTGAVSEPGHELHGRSIAGKVLLFPRAKGSTVGSYVIYALKRAGRAPLAIVNDDMDPIVAAGAVIAEIPAVDGVDTSLVTSGQIVEIDGGEIRVV